MRRLILINVCLALLSAGTLAPVASACPNCKDSIPTGSSEETGAGEANAGLPGGFNASIYVMLSAFVGVLGFVGYTLYRGGRPE